MQGFQLFQHGTGITRLTRCSRCAPMLGWMIFIPFG